MVTENKYIPLDRSVISIKGEDSAKFLQGVISRDVAKITEGRAVYAFILTPQGKYLFDIFISLKNGEYLVDISSSQKEGLLKKLKLYKLRSKVDIVDLSNDFEVCALIGDKVFEKIGEDASEGIVHEFCKGHAYIDPRSNSMFSRAIIEKANNYQAFHAQYFELGSINLYHRLRIENNIPEGERDLVQDGSFPLQYRMVELNAVDFDKGCYVGQEVTARTHHRGVIRKTSYVVRSIDGKAINLQRGEEVIHDGKKVGEMLSSCEDMALALLEKEFTENNKSFEIKGREYKILL